MYTSFSPLLKKWFGIVKSPVDRFNTLESKGLNVFVKIGYPSEVKLKSSLLILSPLIAL